MWSKPGLARQPSAYLQGIDFAGKTGSTQLVSHAFLKAHHNAKEQYKGNGWFVGITPRRNPEIVVAVLFQGGEHGPLAARIAAQVIKAYVEKQRRVRNNPMLFSDKVDPGSVPIAAVWSSPAPAAGKHREHAEVADDRLQGGTFMMKLGPSRPVGSRRTLSVGLSSSGAD